MPGILADVNWEQIIGPLTMLITVILLFTLYYLIITFKHKETMAAIEKGVPLSEIKPKGIIG